MSYEFYKIIHFFSIISLFLSLGALLTFSGNIEKLEGKFHKAGVGNKKKLMVLHGISVLFLLISGFGLIARLQLHSFPLWVILKLCIWLILGVLIPVMIGRGVHKKWGWLIILVSASIAVFLAVLKP